jgi:transcription antitermination factor NusG
MYGPQQTECVGQEGRWCALHTRHQHEKTVATMLSVKGFEIFLPTYEAVHRWRNRNKRLTLPLFPGYLFVVDDAKRRLQVITTPGVHAIVNAGNAPAIIPDEEILSIRRMVESKLRLAPHPFVTDGDPVRIKAGPLAGLEGIVSRKKDALHLVLSVKMLGRSAAVEIDACIVEPIGATPLVPHAVG